MEREEAIKILMGYSHTPEERFALEVLIPELTESEDERIRKTLIEALKTSKTVGELKFIFPEPTREECIAYLEKQKECVVDNNKTSAEEDERIRARLIEYFKGFLEGYEDCYKDGGCVKWEGLDVKSILAWLEKQKEQKPAEWSEEDEKAAYFINQFLEYHEASDPTAKSCKEWFNNRLKSLHPDSYKNCNSRWKPSEEQMLNLKKAYESYDFCDGERKALESLYEQLKDLM